MKKNEDGSAIIKIIEKYFCTRCEREVVTLPTGLFEVGPKKHYCENKDCDRQGVLVILVIRRQTI
jgi:hypothetical protein